MQAKRFLPWELFWQITPEGSTQILDGAWVSVGEEGKEVCALKWIFFSRETKLVSSAGQKHNVPFGLLPMSLLPSFHAARRENQYQKSPREGELQAAACEPASGRFVWNLANPDPSSLVPQLWCRPKAKVQGHPGARCVKKAIFPDDWETLGFACQPAEKMLSRWAGRRWGGWGC